MISTTRRAKGIVIALALGGVSALGAGVAAGSQWGGQNGVIRLSFAPSPDWAQVEPIAGSWQPGLAPGSQDTCAAGSRLPADIELARLSLAPSDTSVSCARLSAGPAGALVDVYAILDDVDLVFWHKVQVRALGGVELNLVIEGEPAAAMVALDYPTKAFNVYQEPGRLQVGFYPEVPLHGGRATIAHWRVYFPGESRDVKFRLEAAGLRTCDQNEGCVGTGTQAVWVGSAVAEQAGLIFGAGFTPAYLNWTGQPDLGIVQGKTHWSETGLFTRE